MSIDHIEQWLLFLPEACYETNTGTVTDTTNGIKKCAFKSDFRAGPIQYTEDQEPFTIY